MEVGRYEKKQLLCKSRFVAWSHRARFEMGRSLVQRFAGGQLLDYGCGDGTFIKRVYDLFPDAVGADLAADQILDCRRRFAAFPSLSFLTIEELLTDIGEKRFDVVTCMETLEHCLPAAVEEVLDNISRLMRREATLIISVPIEVGPPLIVKQTMRRFAGWRNWGDYKWTEQYSRAELLKMTFATASTNIVRPIYGTQDSGHFHGHKGFNWRALEQRLMRQFTIRRKLFSPLNYLGGLFNSQVWFECELKK
jgi:2-polyprenyl-3-methyl-5-hydroxy-6-metoxy-1,4-benzoquinol methylase